MKLFEVGFKPKKSNTDGTAFSIRVAAKTKTEAVDLATDQFREIGENPAGYFKGNAIQRGKVEQAEPGIIPEPEGDAHNQQELDPMAETMAEIPAGTEPTDPGYDADADPMLKMVCKWCGSPSDCDCAEKSMTTRQEVTALEYHKAKQCQEIADQGPTNEQREAAAKIEVQARAAEDEARAQEAAQAAEEPQPEPQAQEVAKITPSEAQEAERAYLATIQADTERTINALRPGQRIRIPGLPAEIYHALPGLGSTAIRELARSPAHLRAYEADQKDISPQLQAIFDFGTAAHTRVLEPQIFEASIKQAPAGATRSNPKFKALKNEHPNAVILPFDDFDHVCGIGNSIDRSLYCRRLLTTGENEVSYFYRHASGIILKARVDADHGEFGADLKTTKDASPERFTKTVKYDYWVQDSLYRLVCGFRDFVFVGVEKTPPYACSMAKQSDDARQLFDLRLENLIQRLDACRELGDFPAYNDHSIHETRLTTWELDELDRLREL